MNIIAEILVKKIEDILLLSDGRALATINISIEINIISQSLLYLFCVTKFLKLIIINDNFNPFFFYLNFNFIIATYLNYYIIKLLINKILSILEKEYIFVF